jgi:hypothetical protein
MGDWLYGVPLAPSIFNGRQLPVLANINGTKLLSNLHRSAPHDRLRILAVEIDKRWTARTSTGHSQPSGI